MGTLLRLGSRKSPLALVQTRRAAALIQAKYPDVNIDIVPISTHGDTDKTSPLSQIGGKGVFVKTIEQALLDNQIDMAVHSLKDMTSECPSGLRLSAFLEPEVITDALVAHPSFSQYTLETLPKGAVIGTSSMRRKALLKMLRPDLVTKDIRGNIDTRLSKCETGDYDAILLSEAGLIRMNWAHKVTESLDTATFVPAPGQGVIAIQSRVGDTQTEAYIQATNHVDTEIVSRVELDLLYAVGLDCRFPFGSYTTIKDNILTLTAFWSNLELTEHKKESFTFSREDATKTIQTIAEVIKHDLGVARA